MPGYFAFRDGVDYCGISLPATLESIHSEAALIFCHAQPWVYSLALAARIREGTIYGASDNAAAYPAEKPHDPKDMAATIYHLLGVDPQTTIHDLTGRPHTVILGRPIGGILA